MHLLAMKKYLFLLFYAAFLFASCSGDDVIPETPDLPQEPEVTAQITIPSAENITPVFFEEGGTSTVSFATTANWTAKIMESQATWCKVSPAAGGSGNHTITITTVANDTPDSRTATVRLASGNVAKDIKVTQKQKDALTVTSNKFEIPAEGGSIEIEAKANVELGYEISEEGKSWITFVATKALKTSYLTFKVAENGSKDRREARIILKGGNLTEEVTVRQEGAEEPVFSISATNVEVGAEQSTFEITVTSNMGYEIKPQADWIMEITSKAVSDNVHVFEVSENSSTQAREGIIVFCNDAQTCIPVTVKQAGIEPEDKEWMTKELFHKSLGMRFTADWCGYCPMMATAFDDAKDQLPDKLEVLSLHASGGLHSPVSESLANQFEISGFPTGYVDGRVEIPNYSNISYTTQTIVREVGVTEANYETVTGASWSSAISGNNVSLNLRVYFKIAGSYKVTALLVEDNIVGYQNGASDSYVHNDVVRGAFTDAAGERVTVSEDGVVKVLKYSLTDRSSSNKNNLRIVVYMEAEDNGGYYYVNNAASAPVGKSQPLMVISENSGGVEGIVPGEKITF